MRFPDQSTREGWRKPNPAPLSPSDGMDPDTALAIESWRSTMLPEKITHPAQYGTIDREAQEAATIRRRIVEWFEGPVEAAHKAHKALTERRKALLDELDKIIEPRNALLLDYRNRQIVEYPGKAPMLVPAPGSSVRENWVARVVDPDAVPEKYWFIDESLLNQEAKRTKGPSTIPGVVFEDIGSIVRRT